MVAVPAYVDPTSAPSPLLLRETSLLLSHPELPLENGYALNSDGMYHVACSTPMPGVTGAMIDWWFGYITTTEQYKQWHPMDHVYSTWAGPHGDSKYIGGHHLVKEYIGTQLQQLRISFKDPSVYFGPGWKADFEKAGVETAVCARVALWTGIGTWGLNTGHVIHLVQKDPNGNGVIMRSRFWLGDVPGIVFATIRAGLVPEEAAKGLEKHCREEMSNLATFLPELYQSEISKKVLQKSNL
jgi:hypothetical protein